MMLYQIRKDVVQKIKKAKDKEILLSLFLYDFCKLNRKKSSQVL